VSLPRLTLALCSAPRWPPTEHRGGKEKKGVRVDRMGVFAAGYGGKQGWDGVGFERERGAEKYHKKDVLFFPACRRRRRRFQRSGKDAAQKSCLCGNVTSGHRKSTDECGDSFGELLLLLLRDAVASVEH